MSFQCNTPRASLRSAMAGGLFISADGTRRTIPDHLLNQAELVSGSRLLRLSYSFCTIEISGQALDPVFEDASIGKLGAIQAAPAEVVRGGQLWVANIVAVPLPESPFSVSGQRCLDS